MTKRTIQVLVGILMIIFSTLAPSSLASAQQHAPACGNSTYHYYGETAWLQNSPQLKNLNYQRFQVQYQGFVIKLHANFMAPGPVGPDFVARISSEEWVTMDNGAWVEAGIVNTYPDWSDNKQGSNPQVAYQFFWADGQNCNQNVYSWIHTIRNTVPDGSPHEFGITYAGNRMWNVYLDGHLEGVSTITQSTHATGQRIGLEYGTIQPSACNRGGAQADRFDINPYYWNGSQWTQWPPETDEFTPVSYSFHHEWDYHTPYGFTTWKDRC